MSQWKINVLYWIVFPLQTKQSPVEELLNQADQMIANQKPKAEVYTEMADTLGKAWKQLNAHLEYRKNLLEQSVAFQTVAKQVRLLIMFLAWLT